MDRTTRPESVARSWQCQAVRERRLKGIRRAMRRKATRQKIAASVRAFYARKRAAAEATSAQA